MNKVQLAKHNAEFAKYELGAFTSKRAARTFVASCKGERIIVRVGKLYAVMTRAAASLNGHSEAR